MNLTKKFVAYHPIYEFTFETNLRLQSEHSNLIALSCIFLTRVFTISGLLGSNIVKSPG